MDRFAFVAGSAHLDLLATEVGTTSVLDKVGRVQIAVGGCACNIATNLVALKVPVRFVSAMNRSPYSKIVIEYLKSHGVEPFVDMNDDLPIGAFSAHIGPDGELKSAVTSAPIEAHVFKAEAIAGALTGAGCAIIDCNLSSDALNLIVDVANSLNVPVYVAGVSEVKALRIPDVRGRVEAVFLNRRELAFLRSRRLTKPTRYEDVAAALNTTLIVTRDRDGVLIATEGRVEMLPVASSGARVNTLGAGDAFLSALVAYHAFGDSSYTEAARQALDVVRVSLEREHCNLGEGKAVDSILASLDKSATTDALTGLYNRRVSESVLHAETSKGSNNGAAVSVMMIDVDHFKSINDTFGHDAGDAVLKDVAALIRSTVRDNDVSGRWGGEEFICVLPSTPISEAVAVADRVRRAIESRTGLCRRITISAGVATYREGDDLAAIVKRADEALYTAKKSGRNRVCCDAEMQPAA